MCTRGLGKPMRSPSEIDLVVRPFYEVDMYPLPL